ncbi:unnamed protein product [Sphenostylis stenocarpa]|uniref:Uncharacterized protein n=1 Tax=Sphenostylis stenocarpa TaxID=92480 RepID=A0AA86VGE5_9FABA|nr:unnamed protein product [Sphenostylis stenocarpa]
MNLRVSGGGVAGTGEFSNDCGRTYSGLLILRDDVHMCGYRDVEVMWNMLNVSHRRDQMEAARSSKSAKFSKRGWKHGSMSRVFFWTNHTGGN